MVEMIRCSCCGKNSGSSVLDDYPEDWEFDQDDCPSCPECFEKYGNKQLKSLRSQLDEAKNEVSNLRLERDRLRTELRERTIVWLENSKVYHCLRCMHGWQAGDKEVHSPFCPVKLEEGSGK
jgi:hypothetical protein